MAYSQNDEEGVITGYFRDFVGKFCDIGANDGITLSNTARLVELGWSGAMVEPHPGAFGACQDRYKDFENIEVFNFAIGPETKTIIFHSASDSLLSTAVSDNRLFWPTTSFDEIEVHQVTWDAFNGEAFDFISIDAEGMDWDILNQMDLSGVRMLCIEHGEKIQLITRYCNAFGLKRIHQTPQNTIFAI